MTTVTHNTNPDQKFSREFLLDQLQKVVYVRFTKATTGEDRIMRCTRNIDAIRAFLPEADTSLTTETTRQMTEQAIRVFDIDKSDWRTFRIETVYHVGDKP